jgi:type I restriction enzyme S subunit
VKEKKIKKDKDLPEIKAEEIPFEIPEGWVWCRLGEIIYDTEGGKSPNCLNERAKPNEWGVIKTTAVQEMQFLENENKVLPKHFVVNQQYKINEGDLLITRAGPKNRVGIVCCVEKITYQLILSDKTIRIKHSKEYLNSKFISLALNSPLIKPIIESKMTGMADSQVNISQDNMKGFSIPLPPLAEQHRIVQKLEQLLQVCDNLQASIQESRGYNEQLLQQVLREALKGA